MSAKPTDRPDGRDGPAGAQGDRAIVPPGVPRQGVLDLGLIPPPGDPGDDVRAICAAVAGDPVHAADRVRIVAAIIADARDHGGVVDPNRVRVALTGPLGLTVYPRVIGATYMSLTAHGILTWVGWTESTDVAGRNKGKPARLYRLGTAA